MTQALFEVQTFDGHGWVTLHRGTDLDAAGEAARRVLPEAKKRAVRILRQSFNAESATLDRQVVFSLGKPRKPVVRRALAAATAFCATLAAIAAAAMVDLADPDALVAMVTETPAASVPADPAAGPMLAEAPVAQAPQAAPAATATAVPGADSEAVAARPQLASLETAAGVFDCEREAARGMVRASNIPAARERLYSLCAAAVEGDTAAQIDLAASLAAGDAAPADPAQAARWYQEAARAGAVAAYRPLAELLLVTAATPAESDRAIAWYHRAALAGDVAAAEELARRYRTGDAVAADDRVALSYDLIAAEAGDAQAMLRAAEAFSTGTGTDADPAAAERWLARAAEAGSETAAAGAAPAPLLSWSTPVLAEAGQAPEEVIPSMTWTAPGSAFGLVANPDLSFEYDTDARELGTGFAAPTTRASV